MTKTVYYQIGKFPPSNDKIDLGKLLPLVGESRAELAHYNALISVVKNPEILFSPLATQEAVLSSKIEGTNVTMSEVLEFEAGAKKDIGQPKRNDAAEVINYRKALLFASKSMLEGRPLSLHLLRETHALLLEGVRGQYNKPGEFRESQNWIGRPGSKIEDASFVPIPQEHLQSGLENWISYMNSTTEPDPLIQLALLHFEFEALHCFQDGNGRLGRMLIPLFLYSREVLCSPSFYISGYLEKRRDEYLDRLGAVSSEGAWTEWCIFFLKGIIEQARENRYKVKAIINLNEKLNNEVPVATNSKYAIQAINFIFSRPIFSARDFMRDTGIPTGAAKLLLRKLREGDDSILKTLYQDIGRSPAIYGFVELLSIADGRDIF